MKNYFLLLMGCIFFMASCLVFLSYELELLCDKPFHPVLVGACMGTTKINNTAL